MLNLIAALLLAAAPVEIKVAVNSTTIESFPVFAAAASLSADENVRVTLVPTPNGRAAMAQLVNGSVDAATGSETQALLNSVADPRIRIVLTLSDCRYRIVARKSSGIRRVADLRGKSVAVTMNTSSQYLLAGMLRRANVAESDVRAVGLEGSEMPVALKEHKVDAVAIWEPHAQNSIEALAGDAVVFDSGSVYTEHFNLNSRTDVLADPAKRLALSRFVQAIAKESERIRTRPSELIPTLAPHVGLSERTVKAVWPQFIFPASVSGSISADMYKVEAWLAVTQKRQPRPQRDLDDLIDRSLTWR
jgi:ABC-type nitrate/sulfonate/bicarbonate transport system substrate-binding protein